jgi:hypothetical protein
MGGFTLKVLFTMPTFITSSIFLTIDYLIDPIEVFPNFRGGRPPLHGSTTATGSTGAHALRPGWVSSLPLRNFLDVCVKVDNRIAAKQLLCIRSQVFLIISVKTHRPQLIIVGRRVVTFSHRQPLVPQRPAQEISEAVS